MMHDSDQFAHGGSRRQRPCHSCRRKRIACDRNQGSDGPCRHCALRGLICEHDSDDGVVANREANMDAAMRAQLHRLEHVIEALERRSALPSSPPISAYTQSDSDIVEFDDVVESMSRLVFTPDGVEIRNGSKSSDELIAEAAGIFNDRTEDIPSTLNQSGFVLQTARDDLSRADLVKELPPWPCMTDMLMRWPHNWSFLRDGLFSPDYPSRVEALYSMNTQSPPSPDHLAELFAVLAIITGSFDLQQGESVELHRRFEKQTEEYAAFAKRALDLAHYAEQPTVQTTRALLLLALTFICVAKETRNFERALSLFPLAVTSAYRLNLDLHDTEWAPEETPMQRYERRALASAIMREDLFFGLLWSHRSFVDLKTWGCEPPTALTDDELPPELRSSPYRVSSATIDSYRIRDAMARLRAEICEVFFSKVKLVHYRQILDFAQRIEELSKSIPLEWHAHDLHELEALSFEVRVARAMVWPGVWQLVNLVHRPFIAYRRPLSGMTENDCRWHRSEVLSVTVKCLTMLPEYRRIIGTWVALTYTTLDMIIGTIMIITLDPDNPEADHVRRLALDFMQRASSPSAPAAAKRLLRLMKYLLDKPRVRRAQLEISNPSKRGKAGRSELATDHYRSAEPLSDHSSSSSNNFSFSSPAEAPSIGAVASQISDLPHLSPPRSSDDDASVRSSLALDTGALSKDFHDTLDLLYHLGREAPASRLTLDAFEPATRPPHSTISASALDEFDRWLDAQCNSTSDRRSPPFTHSSSSV